MTRLRTAGRSKNGVGPKQKGQIEELRVTTTKRQEDVQYVPIWIFALGPPIAIRGAGNPGANSGSGILSIVNAGEKHVG